MGEVKCECGVAGVRLKKLDASSRLGGAAGYLYEMLEQLQLRGQLSAGIVVFPGKRRGLKRHAGPGLVSEVFLANKKKKIELMKSLFSFGGIGQVRYATSGSTQCDEDVMREAQPMLRSHGRSWKEFGIAYNGNLTNYDELRDELEKIHEYRLNTEVDTEVMMDFLAIDLKAISESGKPNLEALVRKTTLRFDGAFSVVLINGDGDLVAFRDPCGIRPLVWGQNDDLFGIASESLALEKIGVREFEDIPPGGYLIIDDAGARSGLYCESREAACMFEFVYFSAAPSYIRERSIDLVRERLGKELAKIEPLRDRLNDDYVVVPVPDTSIPIAQAMADELGLKFVLSIYKNQSFRRGFINKEEERERIMNGKYTSIRRKIEGKKLIVVEDSVVRGETFAKLAQYLWQNGALEVHLRSACPPIKHPCFYGIDFPNPNELIAVGTEGLTGAERKVADQMKLTSMKYMTLEGLVNALGIPKDKLCMACLNGEYPTEGGMEKFVKLTRGGYNK